MEYTLVLPFSCSFIFTIRKSCKRKKYNFSVMVWENVPLQQTEELNAGSGGGRMFVKVMTDEQMEILRKQIAAYTTISEQLVDLHKSLTAHNDLAGLRFGNIYYDSLMASGCHKITGGRQRWTPTPLQLELLEQRFDQENGTPSKQKIKEITSELSKHGQISETNVHNWFQNRRARSKRKQSAPSNNVESEVEIEADLSNEKTSKTENLKSQRIENSREEDLRFENGQEWSS